MGFDKIIGQEEVISSLDDALKNDRIGHAYIFSGSAGIGKKTVAGIFAALLLCDAPGISSPCGVCQACRLFESGANPDFRLIKAEGASIGVDEIREVQGSVAMKPMYSKRKVFIIEDADKMTVQAQNCLLKTLEEPPSHVVLILTASNYESLLETIRSRSQRLSFKKNTHSQVRQILIEKYGNEAKGMEFAAAYADGIIGTALDLVGTGEFLNLREKTFDIVNRIKNTGMSGIFYLYSFFEDNKDDFEVILDMMLTFYRDMLVSRETGNEKILINSDKRDIIFNNARKYSPQQLVAGIEQVEAARRAVKQNANYQLAVEHMLIKLQEV